jgi:hypothetical protein
VLVPLDHAVAGLEPGEVFGWASLLKSQPYRLAKATAMAETENVRRRAEKERTDAARYGAAALAKDLLGVCDNLRRALDAVGADLLFAPPVAEMYPEGFATKVTVAGDDTALANLANDADPKVQAAARQGLVTVDTHGARATSRGFDLLDSVLECFLPTSVDA